MGDGNGVSRGDRNRNAKLARLRELVPVSNAIVGSTWPTTPDERFLRPSSASTERHAATDERRCWSCRSCPYGLGAGHGTPGRGPTEPCCACEASSNRNKDVAIG